MDRIMLHFGAAWRWHVPFRCCSHWKIRPCAKTMWNVKCRRTSCSCRHEQSVLRSWCCFLIQLSLACHAFPLEVEPTSSAGSSTFSSASHAASGLVASGAVHGSERILMAQSTLSMKHQHTTEVPIRSKLFQWVQEMIDETCLTEMCGYGRDMRHKQSTNQKKKRIPYNRMEAVRVYQLNNSLR